MGIAALPESNNFQTNSQQEAQRKFGLSAVVRPCPTGSSLDFVD